MPDDLKTFVGAADEATKPDFRAGTWKVWERYDVVEPDRGDAYLIAQDGTEYEEYRPLAQTPGLFLEFARLADEGEITRGVWLDWVARYGVLGLGKRNPDDWVVVGLFGPVCQEGGPAESHENFVTEARRANWLLRLMESIGTPEGPDYARFMREADDVGRAALLGGTPGMSADEAKGRAVRAVWRMVQEEVRECYPVVLPAEGRFVQGWGFDSLVSAMYLQLMWLLTATGEEVRWCKRPECTKVVAYEQPEQRVPSAGVRKNDRSMGYRTRKDKEFCDTRCKGLHYYHYTKKGKSKAKNQRRPG